MHQYSTFGLIEEETTTADGLKIEREYAAAGNLLEEEVKTAGGRTETASTGRDRAMEASKGRAGGRGWGERDERADDDDHDEDENDREPDRDEDEGRNSDRGNGGRGRG